MTEQFVVVFMNDASGSPLPQGEEQRMHESWATGEAADRLRVGAPIAGAAQAKAVAVRDGRLLVTDGPFPEFKEWFAGFAIVEADSIQDAVALMAPHPSALLGRIIVAPVAQLPWERDADSARTTPSHPSTQGEPS
jgi:hypothetical protein